MKIVGASFVYNDYEYLDETLRSISGFADKHFIVEGAWQSSQKFKAQPRSDYKTYDIINKYVNNESVFLIQANELREREQRQVGLEIAKKEGADWFFMTDADEVYTEQSLKIIKNILQKAPDDCLGFRINSYNFINSFKQYYHGNYMRIYRVTPQASFYMDNDCSWPDRQGKIYEIPGKSFFHYCYVKKNTATFALKMNYQSDQDPTFKQRFLDTKQYEEINGKYTIPKDIKIYNFTGKHPKIMKEHRYFINDVFSDGELKYA